MTRNSGVEIDATRAKYVTCFNAIKLANLQIVDADKKPPFVWIDGILRREAALEYEPHQKCSKIPGMDYICFKSTLFLCLNDIKKFYPQIYNFYPRTYLLPKEMSDFQRDHSTQCGRNGVAPTWVLKPRNDCCGNGIAIIQSPHEVIHLTDQYIIQRYVKPFLIDSKKFDFRLYLLIGSLEPLTLYIYEEGLARFCSEDFEMPTKANRDKKFIHLTNTAINIENSKVSPEVFTKKFTETLDYIDDKYHNKDLLWNKICECCRGCIIAILPKLLTLLPTKKVKSRLYDTKVPNHDENGHVDESLPPAEQPPANTRLHCSDVTPTIQLQEVPAHKALNGVPSYTLRKLSHASDYKPSIFKNQANMLLLNGIKTGHESLSSLVIGSIVNYKFDTSVNNTNNVLIQKKYDFTTRSRVGLDPPIKTVPLHTYVRKSSSKSVRNRREYKIYKENDSPSSPLCRSQDDSLLSKAVKKLDENESVQSEPIEESKNEEEEKNEKECDNDKVKKPKAIKMKKRFFHILGIDIILDHKMDPYVLELNDRPSLCVTVPLEKDLKEGLLAEAFEHLGVNGECYGDSPNSRWRQIYPLPESSPYSGVWADVYEKASHPNQNGEIVGEIPSYRVINDYKDEKELIKIPKKKKSKKSKSRQ